MSKIGYYRYFIEKALDTIETVPFFINGVQVSTATIIPVKLCSVGKLIKYLDKFGRYRVFPFTENWIQNDSPQQIGTIDSHYPSLYYSQSNNKNIGYRNTRTLTLTAYQIDRQQLDILSDIFISPRVYMYVGKNGSNQKSDWILVTAKGSDPSRWAKQNYGNVTINITLPEFNTIKMT